MDARQPYEAIRRLLKRFDWCSAAVTICNFLKCHITMANYRFAADSRRSVSRLERLRPA